uniref:Uncharacterized protein n=1 Tax=Cacopsylla melanoneura TaxID=428564 RepID=A0A8D8QRP5_9HEMI
MFRTAPSSLPLVPRVPYTWTNIIPTVKRDTTPGILQDPPQEAPLTGVHPAVGGLNRTITSTTTTVTMATIKHRWGTGLPLPHRTLLIRWFCTPISTPLSIRTRFTSTCMGQPPLISNKQTSTPPVRTWRLS